MKKKFILIKKAHFEKVLFAIESYMTPKGSRTNVLIWYHNMGLDEEDPAYMNFPGKGFPPPEKAAAMAAARGKWRVKIDHLELEDGTFIFEERWDPPNEHQWIFQNLKGYWDGFDYISGYVGSDFTEYIKLKGTFGKDQPASFEGEGKCQFSDGDNFDFNTRITGGSIAEYKFLLEGLPGEAKGGTFDLSSHLHCIESELTSEHHLTLREMKMTAPTVAKKFLNYPFNVVLKVLETQKAIELDVKVQGDICDPKFHFFPAFTQAFQKSLAYKAQAVWEGLKKGTTKIAAATPDQVMNGLGKVGTLLNDTLNTIPGVSPVLQSFDKKGTDAEQS